MPWAFLIVSIIGAILTLNAYLAQRRTGPLVIPSFFMGWLTAELPLHHIAWQFLASGIFIYSGGLGAWPGWLGLGLTLVSWLGLLMLLVSARDSEAILESALVAALGPEYRDEIRPELQRKIAEAKPPPATPPNPFRFRHPRVVRHRDIEYFPGGGKRNCLDIYVARDGVERAPVLLQIHGGGWTIGNKHEQALPLMNYMAGLGWVCVAANYRLSPANTFPDHLVDLKRAIAWIKREISAYGGDPDFITATGGSAGGHLSALVGLTANDPEYQPGFEEVETGVQAVIPFYGVYDFSNHFKLQPTSQMTKWIGETVLKKDPETELEAFHRASPMHRMHADAPPFFIIHGTNDSLACVEEARHFAQSLSRISNQPVAYGELPGAQHAFEVFHSTRTSATIQASGRFLQWSLSLAQAGEESELGGDRPEPEERASA